MKTDKFRWGIIGPGKISNKFAQNIEVLPNAQINAVASRDHSRARSFASKFGANHSFDSYEALAKSGEVDAVYIGTPHAMHHEHTLLCLENKVPVLCEKPLAMNMNQVKEMIQSSKENNTFLMEAMWTRFLPTTLKVKEIIDQGIIGEVLGIKADFGFDAPFNPEHRLFNPALGGGALLDIGIYPVFLALFVLGRPKEMQVVARLGKTKVDEDIAILFKYERDAIAQLHATVNYQTTTEAFIYGSQGNIHIHKRWHEADRLDVVLHRGDASKHQFNYLTQGYYFEAKAVMSCLAKGWIECPEMSHQDSLQLMETLDQIRALAGVQYPGIDS